MSYSSVTVKYHERHSTRRLIKCELKHKDCEEWYELLHEESKNGVNYISRKMRKGMSYSTGRIRRV
jgi:hypothetical protein